MTDKQIVTYSVTEAGIAALKEQYGSPKVPTNPEEYDAMKADIRAVAKVRTAIDKERKFQTAAALDHQRNVNKIGNDLIERVKEVEEPMKAIIKEIDDAEEKRIREAEEAEANRIGAINARLERIEAIGLVSIVDTLELVEKRLARVIELDPNSGFDEFAGKAGKLRETALKALTEARDVLKARADVEALAEQARALLEKDAEAKRLLDEAEAAEQKKVDDAKAKQETAERDAEQKRLRELEAIERNRIAKEKANRLAARKAEAAPDRDKLMVLAQAIRGLVLPTLTGDSAKLVVGRVSHALEVIAKDIEIDAENL